MCPPTLLQLSSDDHCRLAEASRSLSYFKSSLASAVLLKVERSHSVGTLKITHHHLAVVFGQVCVRLQNHRP